MMFHPFGLAFSLSIFFVPVSALVTLLKEPAAAISRRNFLTVAGGATGLRPCESRAEKLWISGKANPNDKPKKDTNDKSGTKKDIRFLRCLSNCVSDCTTPTGGTGKDRDECAIECQDDCCQTYEQCTCVLNPNLVS